MKEFFSIFKNSLTRKCMALLMSLLVVGAASAQTRVTGTVTDESGHPLMGVTVIVVGTNTGAITNLQGQYSIAAKPGNTLEFQYLGMVSERKTVGGGITSIDVSLKEDSARVDEVVVVGYGTMKRASITGAVSQIDGKELLKAPMGNVTNMLGGRVAGVVALQQSGQPGSDGASILVRGSGAKYIVDGVARDFSQIDPNDIESVSVLKDASSAAIYGMDASAVIIVTTKRGKAAPAKISYTGTFGLSQNAVMLEMLDGPGYAYWYNKAREMDGDTPIFTQRQIDMMLNGDPSDGWGNTNWYEKTFGTGYNQSHNLNVTGGNERIKYFTSIGYFDQEGNVKNFSFDRINIRSNIEAKIAKNWTMAVDLAGRVQRSNRPGFSGDPADWNNIAQQAMRAHPYVPENYNGLPVSTNTSSATVSPLASSEESGYAKSNTFYFQSNVSLKYDFPFLKGLSAKFMVAYDYSQTYSKIYSTPFRTMVATLPTTLDGNISYAENWDSRKKSENSLTEGLTRNTQITTNASLNYANTFGKHNVSAILLMETYSNDGNNFSAYGEGFSIKELAELKYASIPDKMSINGMSSVARKAGFSARVNYDYANKYLVELSCRYDGSYLFGGMVDGKRWSPFPAASVGWRISNEPWFDSKAIDNLKLRASIGLTGTTGISAYSYLNTLGFLDTPAVVLGGVGVDGMLTSSLANENLTWAKNLQYNGGFDLSMWGGRLGVEFDVFYKYIYDILSGVTATYPSSFGGYYPKYENSNKQAHKGFEITLSHRNRVGDFNYNVSLTGTYTKRKWLHYNDAANTPDWLKLTGKEVGAQVGFISAGLFQSQEEIDNSPTIVGKAVRVGDIKYVDRNGDGVISYEQDRGYVGAAAYPKFVGGLSFSGDWKGIDLSFLFQAGLGRDVALTGVYSGGIMDNTQMTKPFYHGGNSPKYLVENSWREDNTNAEFPRLSIVQASSNNAYSSTFWYRSGDYLRLKNLQIGYTFPQKWMSRIGIDRLRIYFEGQNLWTVSELTKFNIDPEQPGVSNGYYPQQRIFSFGVNLAF